GHVVASLARHCFARASRALTVVVRGRAAPAASRRHAAHGARAKVSAGRYAMGLAVPVSLRDALPRPVYGPAGAPSSPREGHPASGAVSRAQGGTHSARQLSHLEA